MSRAVPNIALNAGMSMLPRQVLPSAWIGHLPFAFWVVEEARPRILVELGSHNGTSYLGFCQAVARCGLETKCFAVDTWQGDEHSGFYGDEVFQTLSRFNDADYRGFSQLMRMTFDEALTYFADGSVDLLHIDGLHTYEAVRHDFESWLPKLSDRGVVLFHDTMVRERNFGVWKLWEELRGRYPAFEFQHTHGLGILLVGAQPPERLRELAALSGTDAEVPVLRLFDALGARIYASERADAAEAGLTQALHNEQRSLAAAQSAHEYLAGRIATLEAGEAALQAQLHSEREAAAVAGENLRRLEAAQAEMSSRNSALEAARTALTERIDALEAERAAQTERTDALEAERAAQTERANALEAERAVQTERANALEAERAAQTERANALEAGRTVQTERANALEAEYAALSERFKALEAERMQAHQALAAAEAGHAAEAARAVESLAAMTRHADALAQAQTDLHAQLSARDGELAASHAQLDELLRSTSWKITGPARWLSALLRGKSA